MHATGTLYLGKARPVVDTAPDGEFRLTLLLIDNLGGNEKETHKYVSELLGKETIDTNTYGQTKGKSGSYSTNFQQSGRELLQPDEVRMLDNQNALLFIRGERPILDAKYDLMKHPNIRYTEDGGAGPFNYAKAPLAHDDFTFDETRYDDYELLLDEDIIGKLF